MKKLVFYSDQVAELRETADAELKKLIGKPHPKIGFIPSAGDPSLKYYLDRRQFYRGLGMDLSVNFELDDDWNPAGLKDLLSCDAIHLSGGNTYYFLSRLRQRKMLDVLVKYVKDGGVLIGVSAGSILMTPDITTSSICGDEMIPGMTDFSGIGLVDFLFVPHFISRAATLDEIKRYSREKQRVVFAAQDTGAIIVNGNTLKCIGDVIRIG
jgi:dipeptidase E